jgi:predicted hotdog family 3-hydroxylacyl-ACP dehydratase
MEAWRLTSRGALATLGVALLCVAVAAPASANHSGPAKAAKGSGPVKTRLVLASGSLEVSAPRTSASANGPVKVTLLVTDARGTGAGWTLRLRSTRTVAVSRIVASCAHDSTCTLPTTAPSGAHGLVLRAAKASGMGVVRLTVTLAPLPAGTPRTAVSFAVS